MSVRVLVAMSGGVDSSVAAAMLVDQGYDVTGVTLRLWGGEADQGCCSISDVHDARRVADQLGIDHHVFNFSEDFDRHVVEPFARDHAVGRTPNPCIECNRHLKFDLLVERADVLGFEKIATGHHARIVERSAGIRRLHRGADPAKDQSYVLAMLDQSTLRRCLFPVGDLQKTEVRELAASAGLRTAAKSESQDICFIRSDEGRSGFLESRIDFHPGEVVDTDGNRVGSVEAVQLVTIGQRKGLGIAGGAPPRYVVEVDLPAARVTVGSLADLDCNFSSVERIEWSHQRVEGILSVQSSAHGEPAAGVVTSDEVEWMSPHRRIAAGQSVAFYDGDDIVGSAVAI